MDLDFDVPTEQVTLPHFTREEVSAWFTSYGVSFVDPNEFCAIMLNLRENNEDPAPLDPDPDDLEDDFQESGAVELWSILRDISQHPSHRHRQDARNIIEEVEARERGEDESLLIPDPLQRPYMGDDRLFPPYPGPRPNQMLSLENIELGLPRRLPDDDLPIPFIWARRVTTGPPAEEFEYNDEMDRYLWDDLVGSRAYAAEVEGFLSAPGALDPGLLPYRYMDDPAEDVLNMPEDCPFITAPLPPHDETLLNQSLWPALEIYDERTVTGSRPLEASNYIYKMLAWARQRMAQPETARSYCIVFRGNPRRYQVDTDDEIADEPPPTTEEGKYEYIPPRCPPGEGGKLNYHPVLTTLRKKQ